MNSNLAIKIKELLQEKHLSVTALERKSGLKTNAVRNILIGHSKKPSAEHLLAIAKVLGCTIGELLDEEPSLGHEAVARQRQSMPEIMYSNLELLEKILHHFITFHKKNKLDYTTSKILLESVQCVYKYSAENNKGVFDEKFATWYLSRDLDF